MAHALRVRNLLLRGNISLYCGVMLATSSLLSFPSHASLESWAGPGNEAKSGPPQDV